MGISIYDFLKTVDESNKACEMALRHAARILEDFRELTPEGRRIMADERANGVGPQKHFDIMDQPLDNCVK